MQIVCAFRGVLLLGRPRLFSALVSNMAFMVMLRTRRSLSPATPAVFVPSKKFGIYPPRVLDGGVSIVSRFPIVDTDHLLYSDATLVSMVGHDVSFFGPQSAFSWFCPYDRSGLCLNMTPHILSQPGRCGFGASALQQILGDHDYVRAY